MRKYIGFKVGLNNSSFSQHEEALEIGMVEQTM